MVQQIEAAFADAVYPGDEFIVTHPNHCPECEEANGFFMGRHWRTLIIKEKLPTAYADLSFLTAEAQRFFLPAYLIQASEDAHDGTRWYVVLKVTPPEDTDFQEQFNQFADGFTVEQCAAIRTFLIYFRTRDPELSYHPWNHAVSEKGVYVSSFGRGE